MTFGEPLALLGLALVPLAVLAYMSARRRRRRYAVRYTNIAVLAAVSGRSWTRHVPPLLLLGALAALVVALAQPERTVATERREGTVVMVTDTSGSMLAGDVRPNRLTAAREAAITLAMKLPRQFRLGLVTFGSSAEQIVAPTTDREAVIAGLRAIRASGATAMGDALQLGLQAARQPITDDSGVQRRLPATIILLSDGKKTRGVDPLEAARRARAARVKVFTISLGTQQGVLTRPDPQGGGQLSEPVPPDVVTLQQIARTTGGRYFAAPDAERVRTIYESLGTRVSVRREKRQVTAAFAGGALALLLAGLVTGLLRNGRLP
jgi:Ca-activated chloride channel homolog